MSRGGNKDETSVRSPSCPRCLKPATQLFGPHIPRLCPFDDNSYLGWVLFRFLFPFLHSVFFFLIDKQKTRTDRVIFKVRIEYLLLLVKTFNERYDSSVNKSQYSKLSDLSSNLLRISMVVGSFPGSDRPLDNMYQVSPVPRLNKAFALTFS